MSALGKLWIFVAMMAWKYWVSAPKSHQLAAAAENKSHCLQKFHFGCSAQTMPGRVNAHLHCVSSNILITPAHMLLHADTPSPTCWKCSCWLIVPVCVSDLLPWNHRHIWQKEHAALHLLYTRTQVLCLLLFSVCVRLYDSAACLTQSHRRLHSSADWFSVFKNCVSGTTNRHDA